MHYGGVTIASARDLVILDVPDEARAAHARLLGAEPAERYTTGGIDVVVGAPPWAASSGLLVASDDPAAQARLVERRGLPLKEAEGGFAGVADGLVLGLGGPTEPAVAPGADITGVDHVVLTSPNRDRIIAALCGRLDFDLRLDRVQSWGVHQLFFRRGDLLIEVVLQEGEGVDPAGPDALWGLAWRTVDADATHARLTEQGITVSEVRRGAKPGTRVATVKDPALGVPTIVLEQA
ncbi:Glyoxalase/Bleomycin resistance protein/Dioxygenase superfamily protein [Tsukamurella pulmonis]|uniref:Glyoxalase/Bleomycin resistance protein/Dioxygenase superfamily protein n=2 Tax=Tsukamurella pulmonis TaxID=47312 RepID=A0A1H1FQG9_9ACTN|nr:Glyoxalase/Bleomycin resistance protein/Dioxygenase superfamily protein [Tsukamurella pulmonis]SUP18572.1 Glyoxalase-like domain [Tsukamurella pulmonis]